jgi:hypothetical protein
MKIMLSSRRRHYLAMVGTFLIAIALIVGMVGCVPPSEQEEEEEEDGGEVAGAFCISFDDLALATEYEVLDTISSGGFSIKVETYEWPDGTWCKEPGICPPDCCGRAEVCDYFSSTCDWCQPEGSEKYLVLLGGVNLLFDFEFPRESVSLVFGEYGGNVNLMINDIHEKRPNLEDFDGQVIGGVLVSVVGGSGGQDVGTLTLSEDSAPIDKFYIGGEELCIDDVCVDT